jgi:hypothetical protein
VRAPGGIQEDLDANANDGGRDGDEEAIGYPKDPQPAVRGQHLGHDDAGNGEHEADLDVERSPHKG